MSTVQPFGPPNNPQQAPAENSNPSQNAFKFKKASSEIKRQMDQKNQRLVAIYGIITVIALALIAFGSIGLTAHQLPQGLTNAFNTLGHGGCGALVASGTLISLFAIWKIAKYVANLRDTKLIAPLLL